MKLLLNLCGIGLAGFLGYSLEPNLRHQLTGQGPDKGGMLQNGKIFLMLGDRGGKVELEDLPTDQLPEKILISKAVELSDANSGITMKVPAGNRVNLVRIEGDKAVVSPGEGDYLGRIAVTDTDLLKQLTDNPPQMPDSTATPVPPPAPTPTPAPAPPTTGESAEPPAMPEPPPVPEPAPTPDPVASANPDPTPETATPGQPAADAPGTPVDVVQTMQQSVKGGEIKEFKFDQVTEWKAGEPETVDGQSFQTGTALYKAVTFLGEKSIEAKAFVKDGKVTRWIWPRSGMEIK